MLASRILKQGDPSFWSSSVLSYGRAFAWSFNGNYGYVDSDNARLYPYGVRCVARPAQKTQISDSSTASEASVIADLVKRIEKLEKKSKTTKKK